MQFSSILFGVLKDNVLGNISFTLGKVWGRRNLDSSLVDFNTTARLYTKKDLVSAGSSFQREGLLTNSSFSVKDTTYQ